MELDHLHHAHLVDDIDGTHWETLSHDLKEEGIELTGNPDVIYEKYDVFTIADARRLHARQMQKSLAKGRKIFYLRTNRITTEAQNSLLKTLEEPTEGTHIFISLPTLTTVIPTLRSRASVISHTNIEAEKNAVAKQFLDMSLEERLRLVSRFAAADDRSEAKIFLRSLEHEVGNRGRSGVESGMLEEIYCAEKYIDDRSASVKLLLEHLAHVV